MYRLTNHQIATVVNNASTMLYEYCRDNHIHYTVVGSSGGLDSAVTLKLAEKACQLAESESYSLKSVGMILPCESSHRSRELGRLAIKAANAELVEWNLSEQYFNYYPGNLDAEALRILGATPDDWQETRKIANGNIKARLRMIVVYDMARKLNGMVLSTDNLSEYWMGFWTLHGDVGDFGMIQQIFKGLELYDIARYLEVPPEIIAAKPDDGLGVNDGGDEAQIGASYEVVDCIMIKTLQTGDTQPKLPGIEPETFNKVINRFYRTEYKRENPYDLTREELGLPEIEDINLG